MAEMTGMLSISEKMHPDDTNVFASNIIDKFKNWPDNLHPMCLADFESSYVTKNADYLPIEPDEIKICTVPASIIDDVKFNSNIIVLKIEFGKMWKRGRPCVTCFHKVSKLKSQEEHCLKFLQLHMPWRNENELKQENQSFDDTYKVECDILWNIKKHKPYSDIDYEELQNFDFIQSNKNKHNVEFSMINPNLFDLDLEGQW